jgi:hypothetical protein
MAIERAATPFLPEEELPEELIIEIEGEEDDPVEMEVEVVEFGTNLAEVMDDQDLEPLSSELRAQYMADRESRSEWEKTYIKGLDLLGLKFENRTSPWAGASGVFHPLLTEAVVRFQSQTIQEIFPASGPAKTKIYGEETVDKLAQAVRVANYLNYLATEVMEEYREETEKLLFCLCIAGAAFRKIYYDPALERECSMFVPPEDLVISFGASSLNNSGRFTHVMKRSANEVTKLQYAGFYREAELPEPKPDSDEISSKLQKITGEEESYDFDGRHTLLEMYVDLDLAGYEHTDEDGNPTGVALPYIVTIDKQSGEVLSIYRNWKEESDFEKRKHWSHYQYIPGFGFYGFGLAHTIGGLSKAATSILRQLIDAGTLSNLPGGLKTRGLNIKGDDSPIEPGEFRDVDVPMGNIKDNLTFLPYKEPSNVLYQLLGDLVNEGRRFASAADVKASDINGEAPVGTTLAVLEREFKVMSAIQARIHSAMGKELKILANLVFEHGPKQYPYETDKHIVAEDFDGRVDIIPVADPNSGTMAQRIMQYQAALQLSSMEPAIYDKPRLHRIMLETLNVPDAERIVPTEDDMLPTDPVTENMAIINGKPVKAFLYQDHEAHIQTHMSAAQNPEIQKLMANHPGAQMVMASMSAHVAEHLAYAYRAKVEKELGVPLPGPEEPLPEDIELRLSRLVAEASAQVTGKAQRMAQAEQNAEKQKDPVVQQQERKLAIQEQATRDKAKHNMDSLMADLEKHRDKTAVEHRRLDIQETSKAADVAVQLNADMLKSTQEQANLGLKGFQTGFDVAHDLIDDGERNNSGNSE